MTDHQRRAVVTGASRGLGAALAGALADRGWQVIIDGRDAAALAARVSGARRPAALRAVPGDITRRSHRLDLAAAVGPGGLDLLVNNASSLGPSPLPELADYPLAALESVYATNVFAPLALTQLLLPALRARRGRVVNISSDAAVDSYPGWGGYGSSKAALDALAGVLAVENPRLRVYAVDPGEMNTAMLAAACPGEDVSDRPDPVEVLPALLELIEGGRPSGRYRALPALAESPAGAA